MPIYRWINNETGELLEVQARIALRDVPPDETGNWERLLEMPAHMSKTFLDGQRKDLSDAKAIAKLRVKEASMRRGDADRREITKEIDARSKIDKKPGVQI